MQGDSVSVERSSTTKQFASRAGLSFGGSADSAKVNLLVSQEIAVSDVLSHDVSTAR